MATGSIIDSKFKLGSKIGNGSFAVNVFTGEPVAVKLEPTNTKHPQLILEAKIMRSLGGEKGIPYIHWFGTQGNYNVMVMEYLGPSLEALFTSCGRKFTLKTTLMITDQMIKRIETVHNNYLIHRDMKPDNFLMGNDKKSCTVFVIDFGLAKCYIDPKLGKHIPYRNKKRLTGTARYASIATHMGVEQSRRDDLEGICYVMTYFLRGSLPWQGLPAMGKEEKYNKIMESKVINTPENLCRGFPEEIQTMVKYCRGLKFEEAPDYRYLRGLIKQVFEKSKLEYDNKFDWIGTGSVTESSTRGVLGTDYSKPVMHPNKKAFSGHEEVKESANKKITDAGRRNTCYQPKHEIVMEANVVTKPGSENEELRKWCCFM